MDSSREIPLKFLECIHRKLEKLISCYMYYIRRDFLIHRQFYLTFTLQLLKFVIKAVISLSTHFIYKRYIFVCYHDIFKLKILSGYYTHIHTRTQIKISRNYSYIMEKPNNLIENVQERYEQIVRETHKTVSCIVVQLNTA